MPAASCRLSHADVIRSVNFSLVMFKLKLDSFKRREPAAAAVGGAAMKSIHCSILTCLLLTGVASLAFVIVSAGGVRAEIVTVQGDDGPESIQAIMACQAATASRFPPMQAVCCRSQLP
jgi:hypothetical protein